MTTAIVMGSNTPYCDRLYDAYARKSGDALHVFQCSASEPSRHWQTAWAPSYRLVTLRGLRRHKSDISHVYFNPAIIAELRRLNPDTVVMGSFSPTMIMAGLYALAAGSSLGLLVEGSRELDPGERSVTHMAARKFFAKRADFGICTSNAAIAMMEHWGLRHGTGVLSPHCGSWDAPATIPPVESRPYDLMVCGTLNARKNPIFFADVVDRMIERGFKPRVRIVGDGPLRGELAARLAASRVDARMDGHLQQDRIIEAYCSTKLLMFPTLADTWGLVANEALLCGTAVLSSDRAVSARELVQKYQTGFVRPLDAGLWAETAIEILSSEETMRLMSVNRTPAMAQYSVESAVAGLAAAIEIGRRRPRRFDGPPRAGATRYN